MHKRSSSIMTLPQFFLIGSRHRNKTEAEDREVDKREEIGNASEPSETLQNNKCVNTFNEKQSETIISILTSDGGHGQILLDKYSSIQRSNSNKVRYVLRQTVYLC